MLKEAFDLVRDQMGPCGIACGACTLGNGTVAETAQKLQEHMQVFMIPTWAPTVTGGGEIDFKHLERALKWLWINIKCPGCERGGGPPDCAIKACSGERGYELCSECTELERCEKFDQATEHLRGKLIESKGKSKKEIIEEAIST